MVTAPHRGGRHAVRERGEEFRMGTLAGIDGVALPNAAGRPTRLSTSVCGHSRQASGGTGPDDASRGAGRTDRRALPGRSARHRGTGMSCGAPQPASCRGNDNRAMRSGRCSAWPIGGRTRRRSRSRWQDRAPAPGPFAGIGDDTIAVHDVLPYRWATSRSGRQDEEPLGSRAQEVRRRADLPCRARATLRVSARDSRSRARSASRQGGPDRRRACPAAA